MENTTSNTMHLFHQWLQSLSLQRWESHCGESCWTTKIIEPSKQIQIYGQWTVLILVYSNELKGTYRLHFNDSTFKSILAMGGSESDVSKALVNDFIKEYANLMAGALQQMFEVFDLKVGISLPLITRGFDRYFEVPRKETLEILEWEITNGSKRIFCQLNIEVFGANSKAKLYNSPNIDLHLENGKVEFFNEF